MTICQSIWLGIEKTQHPQLRLPVGVDRLVIKLPVRAWKRKDKEGDKSEAGIDKGLMPTPQPKEELQRELAKLYMARIPRPSEGVLTYEQTWSLKDEGGLTELQKGQ